MDRPYSARTQRHPKTEEEIPYGVRDFGLVLTYPLST